MLRARKMIATFLVVAMLFTAMPIQSSALDVQQDKVAAEIVYNTGNFPITVGSDVSKKSYAYHLFDANGNYTIAVENNAFFPYEVQFTYQGEKFSKWFETPESTVEVGGHVFSIDSRVTDDNTIQQIGLMIDGKYVPAKPKAKEFGQPKIQSYSLIPLAVDKELTLDLSDFNRFQLRDVEIKTILNKIDPAITSGSAVKVAWMDYSYRHRPWKNYQVVDSAVKIDLMDIIDDDHKLEFIVGSAKQLDPNNQRYVIDFNYEDKFLEEGQLYKLDSEQPLKYKSYQSINESRWSNNSIEYLDYYVDKEFFTNGYAYQLKLNPSYTSAGAITIYKDFFDDKETLEKAFKANPSIKLADSFLAGNELTADNLVKEDSTYSYNNFTYIYQDNKTKKEYLGNFRIAFHYQTGIDLWGSNIYNLDNNRIASYPDIKRHAGDRDYDIVTFTLSDTDYSLGKEYKLALEYNYSGLNREQSYPYMTQNVKKAVVGHYDSLEEAKSQADIKGQIFVKSNSWKLNADEGYKAKFASEGVKITVFIGDRVEKYIFKLEPREESPQEDFYIDTTPKPLSADTYFRIEDISTTTNSAIKTYVLPYEHDSYYTFGYQTLFSLDDVDLKALIPDFYKNSKTTIYAADPKNPKLAAKEQKSDESVVDFSYGPVQYTANAENGKSLKNYWVTVLKKHADGAKLFVNGINGTPANVREVYLNSRFDFLHDVFIANIGNEQLTGLKAELINPINVKLDAYWTVGGEKNNTLAAFETVEKDYGYLDHKIHELPNVAKVRLLPDGEGEVSGTLRITADGQDTVDIKLSGQAGDPKIISETIPNAVKYVPYGAQILHSNKYDWNEVSFELAAGKLPKGMVLKQNGEIYGVPQEIGEFQFEVIMHNSDREFSDDRQSYTLIVKDNTNSNVNQETDASYDITKHVGTLVDASNPNSDYIVKNVNQDYEFISQGEFAEFVDFWLNGKKLVRGVDYNAESGSTRITIMAQTFKNKASKSGRNTIAAEYRVNGDQQKELKKAAQNFVVREKTPTPPPIPKPQPKSEEPTTEETTTVEPETTTTTEESTEEPTDKEESTTEESTTEDDSDDNSGSSSDDDVDEQSDDEDDDDDSEAETVKKYDVVNKPKVIVEEVNGLNKFNQGVLKVEDKAIKAAIDKAKKRDQLTTAKEDTLIKLVIADKLIKDDQIDVEISKKSLNDLAAMPEASFKVVAGELASVEVPHPALEQLSKEAGENLVVALKRENNQLQLDFNNNDQPIDSFKQPVFVQIPKLAEGEVIVLVQQGKEEVIVKKSYVSADGNVYAMIKGSGKIKVVNTSKEFSDVKASDWFKDAVAFVNSRRLFIGVDEKSFAPNMPMTRAMFATVLYRLEDSPNVVEDNLFTDVSSDKWYGNSVNWMKQNSLINGYGNGTFAPDDVITREQLVTLMYRYAKHLDRDSIERGDINKFADVQDLSPWSVEAMRWAVGEGLVEGSANKLMPKATSSRAEVAAIIERYVKYLVKKDL